MLDKTEFTNFSSTDSAMTCPSWDIHIILMKSKIQEIKAHVVTSSSNHKNAVKTNTHSKSKLVPYSSVLNSQMNIHQVCHA